MITIQATAKLLVVRVYQPMTFQFIYLTSTIYSFFIPCMEHHYCGDQRCM